MIEPRVFRAAIIGCGRIGADAGEPGSGSSRIASHAASYVASPRTELVALCDVDAQRLARAGERWGDAGPVVYMEEMPVYRGQPYEELRARIIPEQH